MSGLSNLWDIILLSNTFNFIVLAVILAVIMRNLKFGDKLNSLKNDVINKFEDSKNTKAKAEKDLAGARDKVKNVDTEISERIELAKSQAKNVSDSIKEAANRRVHQISDNVNKVISAEEKAMRTALNDEVAQASIDMATDYIRRRLSENPKLHQKYIDDGINELDKVVL